MVTDVYQSDKEVHVFYFTHHSDLIEIKLRLEKIKEPVWVVCQSKLRSHCNNLRYAISNVSYQENYFALAGYNEVNVNCTESLFLNQDEKRVFCTKLHLVKVKYNFDYQGVPNEHFSEVGEEIDVNNYTCKPTCPPGNVASRNPSCRRSMPYC